MIVLDMRPAPWKDRPFESLKITSDTTITYIYVGHKDLLELIQNRLINEGHTLEEMMVVWK
jgi:hypothetical protein